MPAGIASTDPDIPDHAAGAGVLHQLHARNPMLRGFPEGGYRYNEAPWKRSPMPASGAGEFLLLLWLCVVAVGSRNIQWRRCVAQGTVLLARGQGSGKVRIQQLLQRVPKLSGS